LYEQGHRSGTKEVIIPLCSALVHLFWGTKCRKEVDEHDEVQQGATERLWDRGWFSLEK